jgi:hypothetical protein
MKKQVNCQNCNNPFGDIEGTVLSLDFKRVSNIQYDFQTNKSTFKCRKCSNFANVSFDNVLKNEIDYKKTAANLLG